MGIAIALGVIAAWALLAWGSWRTRDAPAPEQRSRGGYGEDGVPGDDGQDRR